MRDWCVGCALSVWTGLAKSRDGAVNHLWTTTFNGIVVKAKASHDARPIILDNNIGIVDQFMRKHLPLGMAQINLDTLLACVEVSKNLCVSAYGVTHSQWFDLGHGRTIVAKHAGANRPGIDHGEVHNFETG